MLILGLVSVCLLRNKLAYQDDAYDRFKLDQVCRQRFGEHYLDSDPKDGFGTAPGSELRHDGGLLNVEKGVDHLLSGDLARNDKVLDGLFHQLADDPKDSTKLFRISYACVQASRLSASAGYRVWGSDSHRYWPEMLSWLLSGPQDTLISTRNAQNSFEWQATRYLAEGNSGIHPHLIPIGRYFLRRSPNDFQCYRVLASLLGSITGKDEKSDKLSRESIELCRQGIQRWPDFPTFYLIEGMAYEFRYVLLGQKPQDGEQNIALYREALRRLPTSSKIRASLNYEIGIMMKHLNRR